MPSVIPLPVEMGTLRRKSVEVPSSEKLSMTCSSSVPFLRLSPCSAPSWHPVVLYCLFSSLSVSSCERLEVPLHSDLLRQLLKEGIDVLRDDQANPQLVQGSRRDLTADQGTDSIFLGSSVSITLRAEQARTQRTSGPLQELWVYFFSTQVCLFIFYLYC